MFILGCQVPLGPGGGSIKCSLLNDHEGVHVDYSKAMCWSNPEKFSLGCQESFAEARCALESDHTGPHKDDSENLIWANNDEPFVVISCSWVTSLSSHDHGF